MPEWYSVRKAEDVTDEIVRLVNSVVDGWYPNGRPNWEDVWRRAEELTLESGARLDLGGDLRSPGLQEIRRRIRSGDF